MTEGGDVAVPGDPVEARDQGGHTIATAVTAPDGSFAMSVPPGTVTVIESICGISRRVAVRSREKTTLTLLIPNAC
jgi:hypothetical protein